MMNIWTLFSLSGENVSARVYLMGYLRVYVAKSGACFVAVNANGTCTILVCTKSCAINQLQTKLMSIGFAKTSVERLQIILVALKFFNVKEKTLIGNLKLARKCFIMCY